MWRQITRELLMINAVDLPVTAMSLRQYMSAVAGGFSNRWPDEKSPWPMDWPRALESSQTAHWPPPGPWARPRTLYMGQGLWAFYMGLFRPYYSFVALLFPCVALLFPGVAHGQAWCSGILRTLRAGVAFAVSRQHRTAQNSTVQLHRGNRLY